MKRGARITVLLAVLYAALVLWVFPKWTIDDAYILLRYAENLAWHGEFTWNPGEKPVEGYTGILLPLLLAGMVKTGFSPLLGGKVAGVLSFFGGGFVLGKTLARLDVRPSLAAGVLVLYFTAPFMIPTALNGLETMLFAFLLLSSFYLFLAASAPGGNQRRREIPLWGALLLVSLARPEGVLLAGALLFALGFIRQKEGAEKLRASFTRAAFFYGLPFMAYLGWKWQYYGHLLPNTFYAKDLARFSLGNVNWLAGFLGRYLGLPFLAGLILLLLNSAPLTCLLREGRLVPARRRFLASYLALGSFLLLLMLVYARCLLIMNYYYRFFLPFFLGGLIAAGVLAEMGLLALKEARRSQIHSLILPALLGSLAAIQIAVYFVDLRGNMAAAAAYKALLEDEHIPAGKFIREAMPPSAWLSVHNDAGAIPYHAGLRTVDFGGINDESLSRRRLSGGRRAEYFYERRPAVAVFTSHHWDRLDLGPMSAPIVQDPRFREYVLVRKYRTGAFPNYFQFVFFKRESIPARGFSP